MRPIGMIGTAILSLTLAAPLYAQQEQHDQQDEHKDKAAEEKEKKAQPEKSAKQGDKNTRKEENNARPADKNAHEQHAQEAKPSSHEEHARGNRIPDDRFRANFGREHSFRVSESDYRRDRRFQYGGYWFGFVQPWPSNWLYTQDVFVVEIDGVYYLCNPNYPGVNITLSVAL